MKEKEISFSISVARISDQGFTLNEQVVLKDKEEASFNFKFHYNFDIDKEEFSFTVEAIFYLISDPSQVVLGGKVKTDYKVEHLKKLAKSSNTLDMPDQAMITMLSIAISHARALLAKNASGSIHSSLIIPIVNPRDIYDQMKNDIGGESTAENP